MHIPRSIAILLCALAAPAVAQPIAQIALTNADLERGWAFAQGNYSVTPAASVFYENYEGAYASLLERRLTAKRYQTVVAGGPRGTVFFLEVAAADDAQAILEHVQDLLRKESGGAAPERTFRLGPTVVIVSAKDAALAQTLEAKVRAHAGDDR